MSTEPRVTRVRHEIRRRKLTVTRIERIAPQMLRVVLGGPELDGFTSLGFDDHVKLIFPAAKPPADVEEGAGAAVEMRDFTPRFYDAARGELWIDFFVHNAGPATTWAAQAKPGDELVVAGPKGSFVLEPEGIDLHLLIGDETAVPAIARRLQELPAGAKAQVIVEVDDASGWPTFQSAASTEVSFVVRSDSPEPAAALLAHLRDVRLPAERCYVWIALESQAARALRRYFTTERGVTKDWIKSSAYWQRGAIGKHERIED